MTAGGVAGGDQPTDDSAAIAVWSAWTWHFEGDWQSEYEDPPDEDDWHSLLVDSDRAKWRKIAAGALAAVGRVRADDEASSVLQLLIDHGVSEKQAFELVEPIRRWFDAMSPDLAEAFLPSLYSALAALPGVRADTPARPYRLSPADIAAVTADVDALCIGHDEPGMCDCGAAAARDLIHELNSALAAAVAAAAEARAVTDRADLLHQVIHGTCPVCFAPEASTNEADRWESLDGYLDNAPTDDEQYALDHEDGEL